MSVRDQMVKAFTKMAKKDDDGAFEFVRKAGPGIGAVTGAGIGALKGGAKGAVTGALTGAGAGWMPDVLATAAEETAKQVKSASLVDAGLGAAMGGMYGLATGEKGTRGSRALKGAAIGAAGMPLLVRGGQAIERKLIARGMSPEYGIGPALAYAPTAIAMSVASERELAKRRAAAAAKKKQASLRSTVAEKVRSAAAPHLDELGAFMVSKLDDLRAATMASGNQFVDETLGKIHTEIPKMTGAVVDDALGKIKSEMPGLTQQMTDDVLKKVHEQIPGISERAAQSAVNKVRQELPELSRMAGREAAEGFKQAIVPNFSTTAKVVGGGTLALGAPAAAYQLGKAKTAALASAEVLLSLRDRCAR